MGTNLFFNKVMVVVLCVLMLAIPVLCQQAETAATQARADAQQNVNGGTWLLIGIFLGIIGYVIALAAPPKAPAVALLGKDPEYAAVYADTYSQVGKKIQMKKAMTGCLIGTGIQVALVVLLVALAPDTGYYYY